MHGYCNKWRLKANVRKSAVMVFSRNPIEGEWKWGKHALPRVSNYTYLGINLHVIGPGKCILKRYVIIVREKLISYIV